MCVAAVRKGVSKAVVARPGSVQTPALQLPHPDLCSVKIKSQAPGIELDRNMQYCMAKPVVRIGAGNAPVEHEMPRAVRATTEFAAYVVHDEI